MIEADVIDLSPNFNNTRPTRKMVVIHATRSGVEANWPLELQATRNWFRNTASQVSAHWVIDRDGTMVRCVPDHLQAWHAGEHNNAYGIELCQSLPRDPFPEAQIAALVDVCAGYVQDFDVPPNHVTDSHQDGFIGHEETAQGLRVGKSDPGSMFPWGSFIDGLHAAVRSPEPSDDLPTVQQAAHAIGYLYSTYYRKDRSFMHPSDRDVVRRVADWLAGG